MKMPKLNKETLQQFFLYHTEKLIIALAVALMGLFFWMGYKTEVFNEATPEGLSKMADQAEQHILADNAWTQIKDSRLRDMESLPAIENDEGIDASEFASRPTSVIVKSLEPRKDPRLLPPTELVAQPFTAPVFLRTNRPFDDPIDELPFATEREEEEDDKRDRNVRQPQRREKDKVEEAPVPGEFMPLVQHHQTVGLRPERARLNARSDRVFLLNGVAITGLVDVKQQFADFQKSFSYGVGYYPDRDRPDYQYVQIERAEVVDGNLADWEDISQRIHDGQSRMYPSEPPEVIASEHYDEVLAGSIPPLTLVDYQQLSVHPKIAARRFPGLNDDEVEFQADPGDRADLFDGTAAPDDVNGRGGAGRRGSGNRKNKLGQRAGSDKRPYQEAMNEEEPTTDYKLVRFFDLETKPGKTYQYRVRLWLADPNNEPTDEMKRGSGRGKARGGMDMGMDGMGMDGMGMDGMGMEGMGMDMGRGAATGRGGRDNLGPDGKPKKVFKKIDITSNMKSPDARARLAAAREIRDPDDRDRMIYFVAEPRTNENGEENLEEYQVPRRDKPPRRNPNDKKVTLDLDLLRFARPTPWSKPVEVKIAGGAKSKLATGSVTPPRQARVGNGVIPKGEPVANVAVGVWSLAYKTFVPAKREARRGELMSFRATSHILNPLTWTVHRADDQEINAGLVVVDAMGGEEVETGRSNEMLPLSMPSEVLVMRTDGTYEVHNNFEDQKDYRHALFIHDDSAEVGEVKKPKKDDRRRGGRGFGR